MIKVDFNWFWAITVSIIPILVLCSWIFYTITNKRMVVLEVQDLQQCPFCTYLFFDYRNRRINTCPRCQSLVDGQENQ